MGSRRATDCIAGDKPVDADSPAPGRRVRDSPTAGVPAAGAPEKPRSKAQLFKRFCAWGMRRSFFPAWENRSRVRAKRRTGRTALRATEALQAASRVTSLPAQTALRRDGACATCPPQVCPPQARGCAGLFASQISFHLSLRPRRGFPCLSPPVALFPACGSCYLLLFRGLLRPLPVCLFCIVYAGFLSLVFLPFPA